MTMRDTGMNDPYLSPGEVRLISSYCAEEVKRQGRGPKEVGYMISAWMDALSDQYHGERLSLAQIEKWGVTIEPALNSNGFRKEPVYVVGGGFVEKMPHPNEIMQLLDRWAKVYVPAVSASEAYKRFEEIHPFSDGNGRTGKIIFNYLNGTLLTPQWP